MNIDIKILNKLLANQIQKHMKGITHHHQVRFILGLKNDTIYKINVIYHISRMKEK